MPVFFQMLNQSVHLTLREFFKTFHPFQIYTSKEYELYGSSNSSKILGPIYHHKIKKWDRYVQQRRPLRCALMTRLKSVHQEFNAVSVINQFFTNKFTCSNKFLLIFFLQPFLHNVRWIFQCQLSNFVGEFGEGLLPQF